MWTFKALNEQGLIDSAAHRERFRSWKNIKLSKSTREKDINKKYMQPFIETLIGQGEISFYILPAPVGRGLLTISEKLMVYKNMVHDR